MTEPISQSTGNESSVAVRQAAQAVNGAPALSRAKWPSSDELIFDDGIPMDSPRHRLQMELLIETLNLHWADRQDFYVGGNMFVYFSPDQVKTEDFRGPDFFVVLGVDRTRERRGWVVWEEGDKPPDVVIELLSDSTADFDKKQKKEIYRTKLGTPEYYWFDPFSAELAGFVRSNRAYLPLQPDSRNRLISPAMGLALARWEGKYQDITANWLRWETLDGQLLPTNSECRQKEHIRAEQERQRAEQEHNRAEQERQRAELLAAKLRELGIDPETLK